MTIGERIRSAREKKRITQTELADAIGTTKQNIYKYENDIVTNIPSDKIEAIAKTCDVSPAYLMGWIEDTPSEAERIPKSFDPTKFSLKDRRLELGLTMLEVANAVGVSEATISRYESGNIKNMRRDRIEKYAHVLQVSPSALIAVNEADHILNSFDPTKSTVVPVSAPVKMTKLPVVGEVTAGYQSLADMQVLDYIACDTSILNTGYDYVYLKVRGDSMEPRISEDDLVLVRVQDTVENGDYAVVLVDDDNGLVKRVEYDKTHLTLISENPYYPPRKFIREEMNRVRIFGKVVKVERFF